MPALRLVLGDQLTPSVSPLADLDAEKDLVLIAEVMEEVVCKRCRSFRAGMICGEPYTVKWRVKPTRQGHGGRFPQRRIGASGTCLTRAKARRLLSRKRH